MTPLEIERDEAVTMVSNDPEAFGPTVDERAELERLRAEVAELRSGRRSRDGARWRAVLATVLIGLGCVLLVPATAAVWLGSVVTDTDRYVATVGPLADDPAVQQAVTDRITTAVFTAVDVEGVVEETAGVLAAQGARPRVTTTLEGLAVPIAGGVESWMHDHVGTVVASDRFADVWTQANRAVHERLVAVLTGDTDSGAIVVSGDTVSLDLAPLITAVKEQLVAAGFGVADRIPAVDAEVALFHAEGIETAQTWFRVIDRLGTWLGVLAVALIAGGVLVARGRRRALIGAGLGAVLAMLALGIVLAIVRPLYLDALPPTVNADAAAAVFDQVVALLRTTLRTVLAVGLVLALAAYLTGPAPQAVALRRGIATLGSKLDRRGWRESSAATWLRAHKGPVQIAVAVVAAMVFVFWDYPSAGVVLAIVLVSGAALGLIQLVAGQSTPAPLPAERS